MRNTKIDVKELDSILDKAERFTGLDPNEVAALLMASDDYTPRILDIAAKLKQHIYGNRIVLFAPLYVSDYCVNSCAYCGFKHENPRPRRKLTQAEVIKEVEVLQKMGHKRLAIEAGEDPENCNLDYILECISTIYKMKFDNGAIRRVNVNIAALDVPDFRRLRDAEIGTYILFQETYHRPTYEKFHTKGPKSDFDYHSSAFHRAMEAGIDDVGAGVLFGLHDYKQEILSLMHHNQQLEKDFGVGFHTISVPRIRDDGSKKFPYAVSDEEFLKLTAILRLAVPLTGLIVSTREEPEMRKKLIDCGITQMSAGSRTAVGGYSAAESTGAQFSTADHRATQDIVYWLMEEGILPSFCTACYRSGRQGGRFMELAKSGKIKDVCVPNGLLTLKEYALDYGDDKFKQLADKLIAENLTGGNIEAKLAFLNQGERDVFV